MWSTEYQHLPRNHTIFFPVQSSYSLCLLLVLLGVESDVLVSAKPLQAMIHIRHSSRPWLYIHCLSSCKIWILSISSLYRKQLWATHPPPGTSGITVPFLSPEQLAHVHTKEDPVLWWVRLMRALILPALNDFCVTFPLSFMWFQFPRISRNVHKVCTIVLRLFFFPSNFYSTDLLEALLSYDFSFSTTQRNRVS